MKKYNKLNRICSLILIVLLLTLTAFGQTGGLPHFTKGESYTKVRIKMLKAGWKPFHAKDADICQTGDDRCEKRPEMQSCAGTGLAPCRFLWKRGKKTVVIFTAGENVVYNGYKFQ